MRAVAAAGVFVVVLAAVAPAAGSRPTGGLYGVASRAPTSPVCRAEEPCSEPAADVVLLFTRSGGVVARARTDDAGRYRVRLPAGTYRVRLTTRPAPGSGLEPRQVRAPQGRFGHVDFTIDTGIR
jgi:hypothetical protein